VSQAIIQQPADRSANLGDYVAPADEKRRAFGRRRVTLIAKANLVKLIMQQIATISR
jgi:hypothetical protein